MGKALGPFPRQRQAQQPVRLAHIKNASKAGVAHEVRSLRQLQPVSHHLGSRRMLCKSLHACMTHAEAFIKCYSHSIIRAGQGSFTTDATWFKIEGGLKRGADIQ